MSDRMLSSRQNNEEETWHRSDYIIRGSLQTFSQVVKKRKLTTASNTKRPIRKEIISSMYNN